MSFDLTSYQRQVLKDAFDSVLDLFGKDCKLVYQPKLVDCVGCGGLANSTYSSNTWLHGGPVRVDQLGCDMCGGTGKKAEEYSENIKLTIAWRPEEFGIVAPSVMKPFGLIQTRGKIADMPKVMSCIELQVQLPIHAYMIGRYKLRGEPGDAFSSIQDKYFIALWDRI